LNAEEIREYQRLQRLFNAPTDNVELIKALVYIKDDPQPLYIGSKKTTVQSSNSLIPQHFMFFFFWSNFIFIVEYHNDAMVVIVIVKDLFFN